MTNVFINIIKPSGVSSAKVVSQVKRKLKTTCGHMGTLDPMASGVLPIATNRACRMFDYLTAKTKTYVARFTFGYQSDTVDATGNVEKVDVKIPTCDEIRSKLNVFVGTIWQTPPAYSAKNIDGKRAYQLAREGKEVVLAPKQIVVNRFELINQIDESTFEFEIECGGGTYIRSLCADLAKELNSVALMSALTRTKSGRFDILNGVTIDEFVSADDVEKYFINPDEVVDFEKLILTEAQSTKILNGVYENYGFKDGIYRVYAPDGFWGIGEAKEGKLRIRSYVR